MSVFAFPNIVPASSSWELVSNTAIHQSPLSGAIQTIDRGGERWQVRMVFNNLTAADRGRLEGFLASLNGQGNRFTVKDHSYTKRGSVTVTELLDVTFDATNWTPDTAANATVSAIEGGIRYTVGTTAGAVLLHPTDSSDGISAPTAGISYAATISAYDGQLAPDGGAAPQFAIRLTDADSAGNTYYESPPQLPAARHAVAATAPSASTLFVRPVLNKANLGLFGSSGGLADLSCARAFLVDNGFNALFRSEEWDSSAWTKVQVTQVTDAATAPDGSTTADEIVEDSTASSIHYSLQNYTRASVAEYWTASIYLKTNVSQRIRFHVDDGSNNGGFAYFDATTGTITGGPSLVGTGSSNVYASIHSIGSGWYRCRISARIPATTTARILFYLCDGASNTVTFNGDGTSGLYVWGAQLQRGGQLGRYTPTTTLAITGTDQTGSSIWLKGLDESVNGQLLAGDLIEIDGHLKMLTADLDGDESGIGLAQFKPRILTAPADEAGVVLLNPTSVFMMASAEVGWSNKPGGFSDMTITAIEDILA